LAALNKGANPCASSRAVDLADRWWVGLDPVEAANSKQLVRLIRAFFFALFFNMVITTFQHRFGIRMHQSEAPMFRITKLVSLA
jgi:hypothetical protein